MSEADGERRVAPLDGLLLSGSSPPPLRSASMPIFRPFPRWPTEFGVSPQVIQLSLTACLLGLGIGQLIAGPIGDRFGRRNPMVVGAALYAVASLGCAFVARLRTC